MISNELSQAIYSQLINGKAINKQNYICRNNEIEGNLLYTEIFTNYDEYKQLYQRIGFELVHKSSIFFFIREIDGNEANDVTVKIQALLITIGRIITEKGYLFDVITDYRAGIEPEVIAQAANEERYSDILHTCNLCIKRSMDEEIANILIARGIMFKNSRGHYVLSNAGTAFFMELTESIAAEN